MAGRPVFLNPLRIHLPVGGWVSILHRVAGVLLFLAFPLGVWALSVSLADEAGYRRMAAWAAHPLARLATLAGIVALAHHFFAGVRHLALDVHWGTGRESARRSARWVLLASAAVTLLGAWGLFA